MRWKRWPTPLLLIVCLTMLTGCPDDDPMISVDDQEFEEGDDLRVITVADATIDNDGFAVIYDDDDGQPGDIIGASELLEEDDHQDFEVTLDRDARDDEIMWAILHYDALDAGEFERPDKQPPVTDDDGQRVKDDFMVSVEEVDPPPTELALTIDDQVLPEDEPDTIMVAEAVIDDDGFVVIYDADEDGELGDEVVGASELLEAGTHTDFALELDRDARDGETLWGRLHYDEIGEEEFIDDDDQPPALDDDEQEVTDSFEITLDEDVPPPPPPEEPFISVSDQILDGAEGDLSTIITVDEVRALDDGWVAVHTGDCTDLGTVIGQRAIDTGEFTDLEVELSEPAASEGDERQLCAVLHVEETDDGFDPDVDLPAVDADDEPITDSFVVEVVDDTAAIRVTLGSDTPPVYTVDNVEPGLFETEFQTDNDVVEMELRRDWRYEFDNTVADEDPFEFANADEEALLSQVEDFEAPLEGVATINWVEDNDAFRFTVSEDFADDTGVVENEIDGGEAITLYQSGERPNMTGPVFYSDD